MKETENPPSRAGISLRAMVKAAADLGRVEGRIKSVKTVEVIDDRYHSLL